jgi:hypothetical protein
MHNVHHRSPVPISARPSLTLFDRRCLFSSRNGKETHMGDCTNSSSCTLTLLQHFRYRNRIVRPSVVLFRLFILWGAHICFIQVVAKQTEWDWSSAAEGFAWVEMRELWLKLQQLLPQLKMRLRASVRRRLALGTYLSYPKKKWRKDNPRARLGEFV